VKPLGGMARHLAELRVCVRGPASLRGGDQKSYLQIMVRTGALLADLAEGLGYEPVGVDILRTRLSTRTGERGCGRRWCSALARPDATHPYPFGDGNFPGG
jgi:hypothetical protein